MNLTDIIIIVFITIGGMIGFKNGFTKTTSSPEVLYAQLLREKPWGYGIAPAAGLCQQLPVLEPDSGAGLQGKKLFCWFCWWPCLKPGGTWYTCQ